MMYLAPTLNITKLARNMLQLFANSDVKY